MPGASGNTSKSVSMWLNPGQVTARAFPFIMGVAVNNQRLGIDAFGTTAGKLALYDGGAVLGTAVLVVGTWYNVILTYDSSISSAKMYVNGTLDATKAATETFGSTVFVIGGNDGFLFFSGSMAEVGLWDETISAATIAQLAAGFSPRYIRPSVRKFYAPMKSAALYTDLQGLVLTPTALSNGVHPRIYA